MRKVIWGVTVLIIIFTAVLVIFAPKANAYSSYWTEKHCYTKSSVEPIGYCVKVGWRSQDDGTGIRVEDSWYSIDSHDCNKLFGSPQLKNIYTNFTTTDGNIGQIVGNKYGCSSHVDLELKIPGNKNKATFTNTMTFNLRAVHDQTVQNQFAICRENLC